MRQNANPDRPLPRRFLALSALLASVLSSGLAAPAMAQGAQTGGQPVLRLGDAAVTGFSGVVARRPPAGGKPVDYFFIDRDGNSLVVFDMQSMKGPEDARWSTHRANSRCRPSRSARCSESPWRSHACPEHLCDCDVVYGLNIVDARWWAGEEGRPRRAMDAGTVRPRRRTRQHLEDRGRDRHR